MRSHHKIAVVTDKATALALLKDGYRAPLAGRRAPSAQARHSGLSSESNPKSRWVNAAAAGLLGFAGMTCADAAQDREPVAEDEAAYKFTPTVYRTTGERSAYDLNLRGNRGAHTGWVGFYRRADEFQQLRLGYENAVELPFGRVVPSLQYATRGFLGGSLTAEIGERYFGVFGWGRTNLKEYYNLNFDPNDAVTIGAGTRALPKTMLTLFQVRDDRLGTGQRVTHPGGPHQARRQDALDGGCVPQRGPLRGRQRVGTRHRNRGSLRFRPLLCARDKRSTRQFLEQPHGARRARLSFLNRDAPPLQS